MGSWRLHRPLPAAFLICLLTGCSQSDAVATPEGGALSFEALIVSIVQAEALDRGVPAIAVALVVDGRVALRRAWGVADVAAGRLATEATTFNIASLTKPFTAALVMRLADEGKLSLEDAVRLHLTDFPAQYREITVRQLLTHTSGIARDLRLDNFDDPDTETYRSRLAAAPAAAPPGRRFEYSNTGYTVLGWIIETIEDRPLDDVLRHQVFGPAGMPHARYRVPPSADPSRAKPYTVADGTSRPTEYVGGGFASGGMSMSVADAAAFGVALQDGRFLREALASAAWAPTELANGEAVSLQMFDADASYGMGWFLARYAGSSMLTHGGGIEGYSANLYHFPAERLTIIALANAKARDDGAAPVDLVARRIADLCLAGGACRQ